MSNPVNHHYVPQHYQRAWATDQTKQKINRYKWIEQKQVVEFTQNYSISRNASERDLYTIKDGREREELETSVMTAMIDTPGSEVISKIIVHGIESLTEKDLEIFCQYLVSLEARNPVTMQKMKLKDSDIERIARNQAVHASDQTIAEVEALFKSINSSKYGVGTIAAGCFASWGHDEFSKQLFRQKWIEVQTKDRFITSNYPVGRFGNYTREFFVSFAVSPDKAILFIPHDEKTIELIKKAGEEVLVRLCNLIVLYRATEAYSNLSNSDQYEFIEKHLNWESRVPEGDHKEYFTKALMS